MPRARNILRWVLVGTLGLLATAFALVVVVVITDWPWWPNPGPRIADTAARQLMVARTRRSAASVVACPPSVEPEHIARVFDAANADDCVFADVWNHTDSDADQRIHIRCVDGRLFRVTFRWSDSPCPPPATGLVVTQVDSRHPDDPFNSTSFWRAVRSRP